jgi:regulator of ribosome biosynthesis
LIYFSPIEKDIPLELDPAFLTVTDTNPIDGDTYAYRKNSPSFSTASLLELSFRLDTEEYLIKNAQDGVQSLLVALFALPTQSSLDGPLAQLPPPITPLPRTKPLPKPKAPTKWERFAAAKGIQKKRRDKKVWDEERQEWINRWGIDGNNKTKEEQWIAEVPANAGALSLFIL